LIPASTTHHQNGVSSVYAAADLFKPPLSDRCRRHNLYVGELIELQGWYVKVFQDFPILWVHAWLVFW
jgi:hypothetical protein